MRKMRRRLAQVLTATGAGIITATTIAPGLVSATEAQDNRIIAHIGDTLEVASGDTAEYLIGEDKYEVAQKSIGDEDIYSVSFTDEAPIIQENNISIEDGEVVGNVDIEEKEMALIGGDGLIDAEEETTIAAAIKKLEADGKDVSYADVQSIVWTVETKETVLPVNTVNTDVLKSVYASIEDGSVMDAIEGLDVTSVGAKSDKNDYVIFYYAPQVTEIQETVELTEESKEEATEAPAQETTPVEVESDGKLVQAIAESVEEVKEDTEVVQDVIKNSATTEISDTVDVDLEKAIEEDAEKKNELKETEYKLETQYLLISKNSTATSIDDVWKNHQSDIINQFVSTISLYDDGSDMLVGFVSTENKNMSDVIHCDVALNDTSGSAITDYNFSDNVIRLPKSYFTQEQKNQYNETIDKDMMPLKAQFMVHYDTENSVSETAVEIINEKKDVEILETKSIKSDDFDITMSIPVVTTETAQNVSADDFIIYLNNSDIPMEKNIDSIQYNNKTGVLTIGASSLALNNIKIVIADTEIKDTSKTYKDEFNNIIVTATPEEGAFPDGVTMVLGEVKDVDAITSAIANTSSLTVSDVRAVDVSFMLNGKEIEPVEGKRVNVDFEFKDEMNTGKVSVFHKHNDDINLISQNADADSASFTVDEFSEFVAIASDGSNIKSLGKILNPNMDFIKSLQRNQYLSGKGDTRLFYDQHDKNHGKYASVDALYGTDVGLAMNVSTGIFRYGGQFTELGAVTSLSGTDETYDGEPIKYGAYQAAGYKQSTMTESQKSNSVPYIFSILEWMMDNNFYSKSPADYNNQWGEFANGVWQNYFNKDGNWTNAADVPLYCAHSNVSSYPTQRQPATDGNGGYKQKLDARVMAINLDAEQPYIVLGFVGGSVAQDRQEPTGIYKIDIAVPKKGKAQVIKESGTPGALSHEEYSVQGAQFGVYTSEADATNDKNRIDTLTTGADGRTNQSKDIDAGTYYIKEIKAPAGHKINNEVKSVNVPADGIGTVTIKDDIMGGKVRIRKVSSNPEVTNGNDCYSLEGAVFKLYNSEADANQDVNSWATLISGADGWTNQVDCWFGTYYAKEVTAPKGFTGTDEPKQFTVNSSNAEVEFEIANEPNSDPLKLKLIKVDDSGTPMPNVAMSGAEFEIKYYANSNWEGEPTKTWTITTNDKGTTELDEFLPAGTFTVQEKKAPNGYKVDNTIYKGSVKIDENGYAYIEDEINGKAIISAKDDNVFEILNERKPEGETDAIDGNTGVQSGVVGTTTIVDTFTYKNLYEGREYTLEGVLLDKETGEPLLVDGQEIRVTKTFTPNSPNGTETMEFEVKTTALAGKSTVVGEILKEGGREVVVHVDVNDERQEVKFPSVGTKAIDKNSTIQAGVNGVTTYVDTVSYTNLDVGSEYKVTGVLMDKETGEELKINGESVTATQTFTPTSESGTVQVEFDIDASSLAGKSAVVFEKLFIVKKDGTEVEVAKHENINDGGQEVATPEIGTTAEDFQTKNHTAVVGETTLVDTVEYKNLIPGKEYTMTGTLMDKETNQPVEVDGKKITQSVTFTPTEREGSVEIKFDVDTTSLQGMDTVFFEKLLYNGVELTSHEEPGDEGQKIDIPKIGTTAVDGQTENHTGVTGKTTIVDTVEYENLTVGQEYIITGIIMDKATGKELEINGETVTQEITFTPETQDGSVDLVYEIDASELKGKDVVVFEELFQGKVKITEHKVINDKGQTVNYPEIRTRAINKETQNQTNVSGKTTIIDTVSYMNLTPGQEYIMQGKLVDKATGEYLKNENGEDIVNRITFTPEEDTGTVEVPIDIDTSLLQGKKIVVFEKLFQGEIEVTAHEDLEDIPQNTEVPTLGTTATDIQTGNHTGVAGESTIVDEVKYTGLIIGQSYIIKGVLMDKETGEPIIIDGKEIVAEQKFIAGEEPEYTHPSVVKEEESAEQTSETTDKATDETTNETTDEATDKTADEATDEAIDETTDKATDETTDETTDEETDAYEPIEGVTTDGVIKLFYDLDATELKGHDTVVFETLYQIPNESEEENPEETSEEETSEETTEETSEETEAPVKVIAHEDLEDEGQTVHIPDAKTTATDKNTTTHTAVVGKTTVVDEVKFTGLTPGETYTFKGVLMDKETGEPLMQDGKEVTAEAEMVAEAAEGSQFLEFEVDTEVIAGRSVVAFEDVYYKDIKITDHKNLEDEDQTVNVPTIATTATGKNGKTVEYGSSVTIVDTVTYTNLTVGESYTMSGVMVDENGNAVSSVKSVPFTAKEANGTVTVEFVVDTTANAGQKLVAFEELTAENGTKITEHKDLTDEGQTVYVKEKPETPPTYNTTPNTGANKNVGLAIGIAAGAAIAGAGLAVGLKKKKETEE